jgi:hypothetical protein
MFPFQFRQAGGCHWYGRFTVTTDQPAAEHTDKGLMSDQQHMLFAATIKIEQRIGRVRFRRQPGYGFNWTAETECLPNKFSGLLGSLVGACQNGLHRSPLQMRGSALHFNSTGCSEVTLGISAVPGLSFAVA